MLAVRRSVLEEMKMICPACGAASLEHDTRDVFQAYRGRTIVVSSITADFCPHCSEAFMDAVESDRFLTALRAAKLANSETWSTR